MSDAIHNMYGEAFTPEELAELRKQVQYGEISFLCVKESTEQDET